MPASVQPEPPEVADLLAEVAALAATIEATRLVLAGMYAEQTAKFDRLRALGVTNARIGQHAGVTEEAVILRRRGARRAREAAAAQLAATG